jgi:hypothetical protein
METYKKYLNESKSWKYMGIANDGMSDFLGEIEEKIGFSPLSPDDLKAKKMEAELVQIDSLWNKYWARLIKLTKEVEKMG